MHNPLISIIIPIYNNEMYLEKCLNSVVDQTFKDIEIICVNDGSTDGSMQILKKYSEADERIKVIVQENSGQSVARNVALDCAQGQFLMFIDGDDWVELNTCEIALNAIYKYDADVLMWDYVREFKNESRIKKTYEEDKVFEGESVKTNLHRRLMGLIGEELKYPEKADSLAPVWGKLYKRTCIDSIRFYDIRKISTFEDGLFNLDVFINVKKAVYVNKALYHYRKDNVTSSTHIYKKDLQEKHERLLDYLQEYITKNNLPLEYSEALNNRTAFELLAYGLNIMKLKKGKISAINEIISNDRYHEAYKKMEIRKLPFHWRIFYGSAKHGNAVLIWILLIVIKKIVKQ